MSDLVKAARRFVVSEYYFEVTLRQIAILGILCDDEGPHQTKTIAETLGIGKPVVTRSVIHLEQIGYVARLPSEKDKRVVTVEPTIPGRYLREKLRTLRNKGR